MPIAERAWHHILVQLPLGKTFSPKQIAGCQGLYFSVCFTYSQLFNILLGGLDQPERCGIVFLLLSAGSQCLESGQNIWECWFLPQKVSPLHTTNFWSNGESTLVSSAIKHVNCLSLVSPSHSGILTFSHSILRSAKWNQMSKFTKQCEWKVIFLP